MDQKTTDIEPRCDICKDRDRKKDDPVCSRCIRNKDHIDNFCIHPVVRKAMGI